MTMMKTLAQARKKVEEEEAKAETRIKTAIYSEHDIVRLCLPNS
jgi:hypothetical protein